MADSIEKQIFDTVETTLRTLTQYKFERNPSRDFPEEDQLPLLIYRWGPSVRAGDESELSYTTTWTLSFFVEIYVVQGDDGISLEEQIDVAMNDLHALLVADTSINGLAVRMDIADFGDMEFNREEGTRFYATRPAQYDVQYMTAENDRTQPAP